MLNGVVMRQSDGSMTCDTASRVLVSVTVLHRDRLDQTNRQTDRQTGRLTG